MYTKHTLSNGIKVVLTELNHYRSTSIGLWIKTGSIDENETTNGISHFIEHMLFKGSQSYTSKEIAEAFDSVGGDLNAFTSKECTCFHAKVLDHHIDIPIKIIADMVKNPLLLLDDMEKEKSVVLDEIMMADDTPDDVSYDLIASAIYKDGSLSRPILGTEQTLESFDKNALVKHLHEYYTTDNMVISIAGSFNEEEILSLLEKAFDMPPSKHIEMTYENKFHVGNAFLYRDIEQVHLEIGFEGISYGDNHIFDIAALNNILGASVSSRLFQNIREAQGLTYSINSYLTQYETSGLFSIYASMNAKSLKKVTKLIRIELESLLNDGISDDELHRVKEQLKGNYILDLEGSDSFMNLLGRGTLFNIKIRTADEVEASIDKINKKDVEALIHKILNSTPTVAIVGRVNEEILEECTDILRG